MISKVIIHYCAEQEINSSETADSFHLAMRLVEEVLGLVKVCSHRLPRPDGATLCLGEAYTV